MALAERELSLPYAPPAPIDDVADRVYAGERISEEDALRLLRHPNLPDLAELADLVRWRKHPEPVVTYIVGRNINYTNFCTEYCTFCAFYRPLKGKLASEGYILDFETIYAKIAETREMGGTGVLMQGGIHPDLKIDWFEALFRGIKDRFPDIWLHCLSASEILAAPLGLAAAGIGRTGAASSALCFSNSSSWNA